MSTRPAYSELEEWSSLLDEVGSCALDELPKYREEAQKQLNASADVGWAIPLGYAFWRSNLHKEAIEALDIARVYADLDPQYNIILGMAARKVPGKEEIAKKAYFRAIILDPYRGDIYYNLGNLVREDYPKIAERSYLLSLELDHAAYLTWHNLGLALNDQDRHEEALKAFRQGIIIEPMHGDGWCNAGLALFGMENFQKAILFFRYTLEIDKNSEAGHVNLGYALMNERRPLEALEYLKKGLELNSGSVNSIWNLSLIQLMLGNYKEGWDLYEARFETEQFKDHIWPTSGKRLDSLDQIEFNEDNPLLVWSEQGMGDAIQFCRYLYLLQEKGIPFMFSTRKNLLALMKNWLPFSDKVILEKTWDPKDDKRAQVALMSLPRLFKTETHTVPNQCPYLVTQEEIPDHLLLKDAPGGIKIGFVWASNPDNKSMYRHKTMPPELLLPHLINLIDLDLIDLHSLQVGEDSKIIEKYDKERLYNWNGSLDDFSDTAFVIQQLDLVISVDTAVAHLSGALGKPTWLLLPHNSDFRWLLDSVDCPWYPSMKIFRQSQPKDWESVSKEVIKALSLVVALDIDSLAVSKLNT